MGVSSFKPSRRGRGHCWLAAWFTFIIRKQVSSCETSQTFPKTFDGINTHISLLSDSNDANQNKTFKLWHTCLWSHFIQRQFCSGNSWKNPQMFRMFLSSISLKFATILDRSLSLTDAWWEIEFPGCTHSNSRRNCVLLFPLLPLSTWVGDTTQSRS